MWLAEALASSEAATAVLENRMVDEARLVEAEELLVGVYAKDD